MAVSTPQLRSSSSAPSNRTSCSAVKGSPGWSATARCVQTASGCNAGAAARRAPATAVRSPRSAPMRCIPVSILTWTRHGMPAEALRASIPPTDATVKRIRSLQRPAACCAWAGVSSARINTGTTPSHAASYLQGFIDGGNRQPRRAPGHRGTRCGHHSVAIAVGLDDSTHGHAVRQREEAADVGLDGRRPHERRGRHRPGCVHGVTACSAASRSRGDDSGTTHRSRGTTMQMGGLSDPINQRRRDRRRRDQRRRDRRREPARDDSREDVAAARGSSRASPLERCGPVHRVRQPRWDPL